MSSFAVLVLPLLAVATLVGVICTSVPRRRKIAVINEQEFPGLSRLRTVNGVARIIGLIVGIGVVTLVWLQRDAYRLGLAIFLVPAIFALTQILATLVAGVLTHDAARTAGSAGLEIRRIGTYLPKRLSVLVAATTVVLALALSWTTGVGVPDDMGRAGRAFSFRASGDPAFTATIGPWPGSFYAVPLTVALSIMLVLAWVAISITVRRPRDASDPEIVRVDDLVRARAVESILAAVGVGVAGTLFLVGVLVSTLAIPQNSVPALLRLAGWSGVLLEFAAMAMAIWCAVLLVLPGADSRLRQSHGSAAAKSEAPS